MIPVLMAGGSGTRLWPLSTPQVPKPFAPLAGSTLFEETSKRLLAYGQPWSLVTERLRPLLIEIYQKHGWDLKQIIAEPEGKNTGPAMAFLTSLFEQQGMENEVVGVFPADHLIKDSTLYDEALGEALRLAEKGHLVLLGFKPTYPATGFGYIEVDPQTKSSEGSVKNVLSFREKPDLKTAENFLTSGNFLWNSGQFIAQVKTLKKFFLEFAPELIRPFEKLSKDLSNLKDIYRDLTPISFDYAVLEKAKDLKVVPCRAPWYDLGCWDDMIEHLPAQNSTSTSGSYVYSEFEKPVAILGARDLIVANTKEGLLIAKKGHTQGVKDLKLPPGFPPQREVRPWGHFEILSDRPELKTKIITVLPGQSLSLQSHKKRDELWVMLEGMGEVTLDDKVHTLTTGQSIQILKEQKHRMSNTSDKILKFFELQTGDYFGEDDIQRFEDRYGRAEDQIAHPSSSPHNP